MGGDEAMNETEHEAFKAWLEGVGPFTDEVEAHCVKMRHVLDEIMGEDVMAWLRGDPQT